ncbi:hypothetical protein CQW23_27517 [Capsicum baccatum]|uniref:C-JID domain-containing protein n=1 Tax=Capsicum baccatum TaxID=33114 RepID=A0A2G2VDX4_CAPBA|nr:hypothetical protein CQW23_27517 [Capsicum baccatum]
MLVTARTPVWVVTEHLPRSIAQLGALRCLDLSHCKRLTQLPEFPVQLDTIEADWTNYWICNSLFRNLSLLQHDICASDSLSLRVITGWRWHGMPRFPYQGIDGVSVYLPKNWYIHDSFSGFAVCYHGILTDITAHLIPLNDDGVSCITRKLVLSNHSKYSLERNGIHFFLIPFAGLWDISKANGKTPNDYRHIMKIRMNIASGQGGPDLMIANTMMKPVAPLLRNKHQLPRI